MMWLVITAEPSRVACVSAPAGTAPCPQARAFVPAGCSVVNGEDLSLESFLVLSSGFCGFRKTCGHKLAAHLCYRFSHQAQELLANLGLSESEELCSHSEVSVN
jgi:hypothetical protein